MRRGNLAVLAFLILSLTLFLSGCGPTNQSPNASFSANPTSGEAPLEVSFDASGSSDPEGNIISYEWDFGDGSTGSGETLTHTYDSAGNYIVELTVTDNDGATDTTTKSIDVSSASNNPPTASFTASPTSGVVPLEVSFDASGSSDSDGTIESYSWDFDDGSTDSGVSVTNTFDTSGTYNIELTVTDNDGATDSISKTISVSSPNQPPTPSFTAEPTSGEAPLEVSFDAGGSLDSDGSIASYDWDFGNGSAGSGETITHTYDNTGDYTVELTVSDNDGASDSTTVKVEVEPEELTASFTWEPAEPELDEEVTFDASDSTGEIESYEWDFGDEKGTNTGKITTYTYDEPGDYSVEFTVTDKYGAEDSVMKEITISLTPPSPPQSGKVRDLAELTLSSKNSVYNLKGMNVNKEAVR